MDFKIFGLIAKGNTTSFFLGLNIDLHLHVRRGNQSLYDILPCKL